MNNYYYPKIRIWENTNKYITYISLGDKYKKVSDILKKNDLDTNDKNILENEFGENYINILGLNLNEKIKYNNKIFLQDDTLNIFKKRIALYYDLPSINDIYLWYNINIKNNIFAIKNFIHHLFKRDSKINFTVFKTIVKNTFDIDIKDTYDYNLIDKTESTKILLKYNPEYITEALGFKYIYDTFIEFINYNPIKTNEEIIDISSLNVVNYSNYLINTFAIHNDIINIIHKDKSNKNDYLYPFSEKNILSKEDIDFINIINKNEELISETENIDKIDLQSIINHIHIKGNDNSINTPINLEKLFENLKTSNKFPFIKFKTLTNIYVKLWKSSLINISKEDIEKWSKLTNFKDDKSYINIKYNYQNKYFISILIYNDLSYHIKYNISIKEKQNILDIIKTFDEINKLLIYIQNLFPNNIITLLDSDIFYNPKETDNIKILNLVVSTSMQSNIKNINYKNFSTIIKNVLYPYFSIIENKTNNLLYLQYKKVNNFTKISNINIFINQNLHLNEDDLIKQIMFTFMLSKDEAEKELISWKIKNSEELKNKEDTIIKYKNENFVNIKIRLNNSIEFKYITNGLTNYSMYNRIEYLINKLLVLANKKFKKTDENKEELYDKVNENNNLPQIIIKNNNLNVMNEINLNENNYVDIDVDILDDFEKELLELEKEFVENKPEIENEIKQSKKIKEDKKIEDDPNQIKGYVLKKLYEADKQLFDYDTPPDKKRQDYASKCGWVDKRQPIVLTKDEYKNISKNHPDALIGYVKTGSTHELQQQNYYVCPKIWCTKSKVALSYEEFTKNNNKCPDENDKPLIFKPNRLTDEAWVKYKQYPSFLPASTHPGHLCVPCCFVHKEQNENKSEKSKSGMIKQRKVDCITNELIKTHPENKNNDEQNYGNEKYIKSENYSPLEINRYGLLPNDINKFFRYNNFGNRHDGTGLMTENTECLLRKGIKISNQSYFESLIHCFNNPKITSVNDLLNVINDKFDVITFLSLENGRIMKMFVDESKNIFNKNDYNEFKIWFLEQKKYILEFNLQKIKKKIENNDLNDYKDILREFIIYYSFVNYKNYINNPNIIKHHIIVNDLLCNNLKKYINILSINFLIIEYNHIDNTLHIDCNINKNSNQFIDYNKPFSLIFKRNSYYEPIYYINNSNNTLLSTHKLYYSENKQLKKFVDFYVTNCSIKNTKNFSVENILIFLKSIKLEPKFIVIDYGYKSIGVLCSNNLYIPFISRQDLIYIKNIKYIYINDVLKFKCLLDHSQITDIYKKVAKYTKHQEFYKISKFVDNIGFYINNNVFIPLNIDENSDYSISFYNGLYILIGIKFDDIRTDIIKGLDKKQIEFDTLLQQIYDIIEKNEDIRTEYNFLKDKLNPFPYEFKKQKLYKLFKTILEHLNYDDKYLQRLLDTVLEKIQSKMSYYKSRIHRYNTIDGEEILDYIDIQNNKIYQLKEYVENPYESLIKSIDNIVNDYTFVEKSDIDISNYINDNSIYKQIPVKFRKILKDFSILSSENTYNPRYIYDIFKTLSQYGTTDYILDENLIELSLNNDIINDYKNNDLEEFLNNPWLKQYMKQNKIKEKNISLNNYLEFIKLLNYYPSIYELKKLAVLAKVNLIIIGRKTLKSPDEIDIMNNKSSYYLLISYYYDRNSNLDKFELYIKNNKFLFNEQDLGEQFIEIINKKLFNYKINETELIE